MRGGMMDVSIIIVNYNTVHYTLDAIDSIFEKTEGINYEIIVVDNNSGDNSKEIIGQKYGDSVRYLGLPENIGFGRANNEGAKIAKGRNLFLLNPDTVLLNNAVKILSDYLDDNPKVGCCGGNLVDADRKPIHSFRRYIPSSIFDEINNLLFMFPEKLFYGRNVIYNHTTKPMKVGYITGADLMIRKILFDEQKGFSKDFFMYSEEVYLELRIKKSGFLIMSVPAARIIHFAGKSIPNDFDRFEKMFAARRIFLYKTKGAVEIGIINMLFSLTVFSRLMIWNILGKKEKVAYWNFIRKQLITPPPPPVSEAKERKPKI
jgi:GT2 family glycosyltransferase